MLPARRSYLNPTRQFWSCAFSGPAGRQIHCRWREPPVYEHQESEARRADTRGLCRPFSPETQCFCSPVAHATGRGCAGLPAL